MQSRSYTVGELRQIIKESVSEFKPKFGDGVQDTEQSDSEKTYKDIAKETSKMTGDAKTPTPKDAGKAELAQTNMGMSDLQYDGPVDKKFVDRAKANLKGYTSDLEEKNHANEAHGNATFDDAIEKEAERTAADVKAMQDANSEAGITNAQRDKKDVQRHETNIGESKKLNILKFKKVQFISEGQMLVHVPDEYKTEGKKFYMQDCKGNKYLVEWHKEPEVKKMLNEAKTNAEMDRIKYLFNYSGKESNTNSTIRMNENKEIDDMLGRVRQLMKS